MGRRTKELKEGERGKEIEVDKKKKRARRGDETKKKQEHKERRAEGRSDNWGDEGKIEEPDEREGVLIDREKCTCACS